MVTGGAQQCLKVYLLTGTVGRITLLAAELSCPENQQGPIEKEWVFWDTSSSLDALCQEM